MFSLFHKKHDDIKKVGRRLKTAINAVFNEMEKRDYPSFVNFVQREISTSDVYIDQWLKQVNWILTDLRSFNFSAEFREPPHFDEVKWGLSILGHKPYEGFMVTVHEVPTDMIGLSVDDGIQYRASNEAKCLMDYMKGLPGFYDLQDQVNMLLGR